MSGVTASVLLTDGVILSLSWDDPGWRFLEWEDLTSREPVLVAIDDLDRRRCFESIENAQAFFCEKYHLEFAARRRCQLPRRPIDQ